MSTLADCLFRQSSDLVRSSAVYSYRQTWTRLIVPAVAGTIGALIELHF